MTKEMPNLKEHWVLRLSTYVECCFWCLSFLVCHTRGWVGLSELPKPTPKRRMEKESPTTVFGIHGQPGDPCIQAYPPLFTHLDVRVICNNLCHMTSTLSVVSCRICQTHSLLRHTLTRTVMRNAYWLRQPVCIRLSATKDRCSYNANALREAWSKSVILRGRTFAFMHHSELTL
jgi:hypothetical protein